MPLFSACYPLAYGIAWQTWDSISGVVCRVVPQSAASCSAGIVGWRTYWYYRGVTTLPGNRGQYMGEIGAMMLPPQKPSIITVPAKVCAILCNMLTVIHCSNDPNEQGAQELAAGNGWTIRMGNRGYG